MTKNDRYDVNVPCFGDMNGCRVDHCNVARYCYMETLARKDDASIGPDGCKRESQRF